MGFLCFCCVLLDDGELIFLHTWLMLLVSLVMFYNQLTLFNLTSIAGLLSPIDVLMWTEADAVEVLFKTFDCKSFIFINKRIFYFKGEGFLHDLNTPLQCDAGGWWTGWWQGRVEGNTTTRHKSEKQSAHVYPSVSTKEEGIPAFAPFQLIPQNQQLLCFLMIWVHLIVQFCYKSAHSFFPSTFRFQMFLWV